MKGTRYWWYRWTGRDGKRHAVSLKTDDEAEAIKKARTVSLEANARPDSPVLEVIERYLNEAQARTKRPMRAGTAQNVRYILTKFVSDRSISEIGDVTAFQLAGWLQVLSRSQSQETVCTYASLVLTFGRWLHKRGLVTYDPFPDFERPSKPARGRSKWIRKEEVQKLIDSAPSDELKFVLYAGFHAGLRRGEVSWARVNWFDLENNLAHVVSHPETPGALLKDENRVVPLTKPFGDFLRGYLRNRQPDEFVLAPKKQKGKAKYRYDFLKSFQSHVKSCTIHDMRRSFASNLASAGVSIYKIAQWLGDRVDVVERSYGHLAPADQDVNKLL